MPVEDHLSQYLQTVRREKSADRGEVPKRVEALMDELQLPWSAEPEGDSWKIDSDIGLVRAGLDEDQEVLTIHQLIHPWDGKARKNRDYMHGLLRMNATTTGACCAITDLGGDEWLMVVGRIAAEKIDKEELALTLESVFRMAGAWD